MCLCFSEGQLSQHLKAGVGESYVPVDQLRVMDSFIASSITGILMWLEWLSMTSTTGRFRPQLGTKMRLNQTANKSPVHVPILRYCKLPIS